MDLALDSYIKCVKDCLLNRMRNTPFPRVQPPALHSIQLSTGCIVVKVKFAVNQMEKVTRGENLMYFPYPQAGSHMSWQIWGQSLTAMCFPNVKLPQFSCDARGSRYFVFNLSSLDVGICNLVDIFILDAKISLSEILTLKFPMKPSPPLTIRFLDIRTAAAAFAPWRFWHGKKVCLVWDYRGRSTWDGLYCCQLWLCYQGSEKKGKRLWKEIL